MIPILSLLFVAVQWLVAAEPPTIPPPGEDTVLMEGKPAREFFEKRFADSACRAQLGSVRTEYQESKEQLNQAIQQGVDSERLDELEQSTIDRKKRLISLMFKCGDCAMTSVERRDIETPAGSQVWYMTDGSCSLYGDGSEGRYQKARDFLRGTRNYPQYLGGFSHVLEYVAVDPKTGALLRDLNISPTPQLDIFISIRGVDFAGMHNAISYFFGRAETEKVMPGHSEYSIQFRSKKATPGFKRPPVFYLPAAGKVKGQFDLQKQPVTQWNIKNVMGSWYVNSDGYLRYFTAADFGELFEGTFGLAEAMVSEDSARDVLGDTLFDLAEVARGEH